MIYVSGALQGSNSLDEARFLYERMGEAIDVAGGKAYVPHVHTDPVAASHLSAGDVHSTDMGAIDAADAIIVNLNEPSHGVGAEVAIAVQKGIPIFATISSEKRCSRFLEGMLNGAGVQLFRYETVEEMLDAVRSFVRSKFGNGIQHSSCARFDGAGHANRL